MDVWGGNQYTFSSFERPGVDIWLYSRPFEQNASGGDVYLLSSCASGRITRMLVADVSGHGHAAAEPASHLRGLMRRHINEIRPNRLFEEINAEFSELSFEDGFATSLLHSFFSPSRTLSVCNAGHPSPLVLRREADNWEPLEFRSENEDIPLGVADGVRYTQYDVRLEDGDLVFSYTDGVSEAPNLQGDPLGSGGLRSILDSLSSTDPERLLPCFVEQIALRHGRAFHADDVTMLLYRVTNRSVPLSDNFAAPFRWLKSKFL
jgi:sigma-B regulation protein RsbU (phosphoserine phosphatase)